MRRISVTLLGTLIAAVLGTAGAWAAGIGMNSSSLAAGSASVSSCDANTDSWGVSYTNSSSNDGTITQVVLDVDSGLTTNCADGTVDVTTVDGSKVVSGHGSVAVSACSSSKCVVPLSKAVDLASIAATHFLVTAP